MADKVKGKSHSITTIVGVILCVIFGLMLLINIVIVAKGSLDSDTPPSIFGITPLVTLSGSMSGDRDGHIEAGDLILIKKANTSNLKVGDVISFVDSKSKSKAIITHRIVEITTEDGEKIFYTQGDYNKYVKKDNTRDRVPEKDIMGVVWFRIPRAGHFSLFLQKPLGMAIFMGVPVCVYIIFDLIRRKRAKEDEALKDVLFEAEIARIKAKNTFSVDDDKD